MTGQTNEPSRLELYKAGKLEERRSPRHNSEPVVADPADEEESAGISMRPELMAIALLLVVLLIVTAIAL